MSNSEAHVRIDKGIKRGPQNRLSTPHRRDPVTGEVQAIPPDLDPNEVLNRYLSEETTSSIAKSYGISRKSMVAWLRQVVPNEWKRVQQARAFCRKEDGDEGIEGACDALGLARAREMLRSGQWELERIDDDYRQKQELTVEIVGDLGDRLRRARERVIEGEVVKTVAPIVNAAVLPANPVDDQTD